jgi:hypothetical protein
VGLQGERDFHGQTSEFALTALDLLSQSIALIAIQLNGCARQAAVGPAQNSRRHLQIP